MVDLAQLDTLAVQSVHTGLFPVEFQNQSRNDYYAYMSDAPNRVDVMFTEASQLPNAERAAYLGRACGDDVALRQKVEALLQAHDHARKTGNAFTD